MTKLFLGTVAAAWLVLVTAASAAEIKVLAAGGMRPGLNAAAKVFREQTGVEVKFTYEPPVDLGKRVAGGEAADIVVSSPNVVADLTRAGKVLPDGQMHLGRVGVGVVARDGDLRPQLVSCRVQFLVELTVGRIQLGGDLVFDQRLIELPGRRQPPSAREMIL